MHTAAYRPRPRYAQAEVTLDFLARVNTNFRKNVIVTLKSKINCIKREAYDEYELEQIDVSEYDFTEEDMKNIENVDSFSIITTTGKLKDPMNEEITEILEVFDFDFGSNRVLHYLDKNHQEC